MNKLAIIGSGWKAISVCLLLINSSENIEIDLFCPQNNFGGVLRGKGNKKNVINDRGCHYLPSSNSQIFKKMQAIGIELTEFEVNNFSFKTNFGLVNKTHAPILDLSMSQSINLCNEKHKSFKNIFDIFKKDIISKKFKISKDLISDDLFLFFSMERVLLSDYKDLYSGFKLENKEFDDQVTLPSNLNPYFDKTISSYPKYGWNNLLDTLYEFLNERINIISSFVPYKQLSNYKNIYDHIFWCGYLPSKSYIKLYQRIRIYKVEVINPEFKYGHNWNLDESEFRYSFIPIDNNISYMLVESYSTENTKVNSISKNVSNFCKVIELLDDNIYLINYPNDKLVSIDSDKITFVNNYGFNKDVIWQNIRKRIEEINISSIKSQ